uniref:Sugar phosphate transporter domain-containing protein n=1 Tax=Guillardia theta TaxID=55529 RepID=A0A7S4MYY6_GUITH|mmetsp:Transcript_13857/g.47916  ORF Transcript_13857/g.47916 Transcript_13857/m.47916 type:complete len:317 (+) Transcript_13857:566-1516(+)
MATSRGELARREEIFGLLVCLAYASTSIAITYANKIVLSSYGFHFEVTLILAQLALSTASILLLFLLGVCSAPPLNFDTLVKTLPLSFWFFAYVITGLSSLRSLSVPTWSAMRRLTALCILFLDWFSDSKLAPMSIWLSIVLMLLGAILAGLGDFEGSLRGYVHVACNCLSSALYLRAVTQVKKKTGMSEMGVLMYTNMWCLLPVALFVLLSSEFHRVSSFPLLTDSGFLASLFGSSILSGLLNYLVFLSASVNSPLTTCVTGQAKNVVSSLGGFIFMPPAEYSIVHISGCLLGLMASVWYATLKFLDSQSRRKQD